MHHMLIGFEADRYPELSEYEVMEKIGEGTFSVVWRARCRATNEEVALKIVTPTSGPSRTANEMDLLLNHGFVTLTSHLLIRVLSSRLGVVFFTEATISLSSTNK
jgi:serine/threonine protein kinase